jgi:excisionase family DNA binding protein
MRRAACWTVASDHQPPRDFLTIGEAAAYVGVSQRTILRRLRDGTLTRHRLGGAVRINRAELDRRMDGLHDE